VFVGDSVQTPAADLVTLALEAQRLFRQGQLPGCREVLGRIIERDPDYPGAQALLAHAIFPGPHYREVLKQVHDVLRPKTYLEIGVESGATLALASACELAAGVDPDPLDTVSALPPHLKVFRQTSDAFFETHDRAAVFGERPLDFVFIDGLHRFENALRDFMHVESWASPHTTLLMHDCLPVCDAAASPQRVSKFWVGDVWKVLEVLLELRPDLRIAVIPAPPSGLVVVRGLDCRSTVLRERLPSIAERYAARSYPHVYGEWPESYRVVENSNAGIKQALA